MLVLLPLKLNSKPQQDSKTLLQVAREAVDAPPLEVFKVRLDGALSKIICKRCPCPGQGGLD